MADKHFGGFSFNGVQPKLPVRTSGALRKTYRNFKEFRDWFDAAQYKVAAAYQAKDGIDVLLTPKEGAK